MEISFLKAFFAALFSFLVAFYLIPLLCSFARRTNFLDLPDGKIKQHDAPIPYMGGIAVYAGFLLSLALFLPFRNEIISFMIGITLLLFVGLLDDFFVLKPYQKLFGQFIVALCFLKSGFYLKEQFFARWEWLGIVVSLVWMIGVINAFNLVDVMDGLATTIALCSIVSFIGIAILTHVDWLVLLLSSLFGALLAFFFYNRPSASIYLGDAGALFLGGFFAATPFFISWGEHSPYGFFAPAIILAVPLLEVSTLIIVRFYKGIPFYQGSPDHFSHYLLKKGWSKWQILGYVALLCCATGVVAVSLVANFLSLGCLIALGGIFLAAWHLVLFS